MVGPEPDCPTLLDAPGRKGGLDNCRPRRRPGDMRSTSMTSVVCWLEGDVPTVVDPRSDAVPTRGALARDLAAVVTALREIDVPHSALADPELRWSGGPRSIPGRSAHHTAAEPLDLGSAPQRRALERCSSDVSRSVSRSALGECTSLRPCRAAIPRPHGWSAAAAGMFRPGAMSRPGGPSRTSTWTSTPRSRCGTRAMGASEFVKVDEASGC